MNFRLKAELGAAHERIMRATGVSFPRPGLEEIGIREYHEMRGTLEESKKYNHLTDSMLGYLPEANVVLVFREEMKWLKNLKSATIFFSHEMVHAAQEIANPSLMDLENLTVQNVFVRPYFLEGVAEAYALAACAKEPALAPYAVKIHESHLAEFANVLEERCCRSNDALARDLEEKAEAARNSEDDKEIDEHINEIFRHRYAIGYEFARQHVTDDFTWLMNHPPETFFELLVPSAYAERVFSPKGGL